MDIPAPTKGNVISIQLCVWENSPDLVFKIDLD